MAWQQHVADIALEYDPATGKPFYRTVTLLISRQNGKTHLILCIMLARCLLWGSKQSVVFAAQTGKDVRGKWKKDLLPKIQVSSLQGFVRRAYLSDGDTNLLWKNGSRINMVDNTPEAGMGMTLDLVMLDEAFAFKDDAPETSFGSTIATRPFAQIWNVSTAGTPSSTYLWQKVVAGRAAVKRGDTTGTAYFEWGVPEDEDPYDVEVLKRRFPAWGVTIDEDYIRWAMGEFSTGTYHRNIGNQWTETEERVIPAEWWRAVTSHDVETVSPIFAIDARADHSMACVVKADASGNVELVASKPGIEWLRTEIPEKVGKSVQLVVDGYGPAADIADDLEKLGHRITRTDSLQSRKACGRFYDAVADRKIQVRTDTRLDDAVPNATKRITADTFAWHRDSPGGELLMAMSLAYATAVTEFDGFTPFAWS